MLQMANSDVSENINLSMHVVAALKSVYIFNKVDWKYHYIASEPILLWSIGGKSVSVDEETEGVLYLCFPRTNDRDAPYLAWFYLHIKLVTLE